MALKVFEVLQGLVCVCKRVSEGFDWVFEFLTGLLGRALASGPGFLAGFFVIFRRLPVHAVAFWAWSIFGC